MRERLRVGIYSLLLCLISPFVVQAQEHSISMQPVIKTKAPLMVGEANPCTMNPCSKNPYGVTANP